MLIYFLLLTIYLAYLAFVTREYCYGRQLWCMLSLRSFWSRRGAAIGRRAMGYEIKSRTVTRERVSRQVCVVSWRKVHELTPEI